MSQARGAEGDYGAFFSVSTAPRITPSTRDRRILCVQIHDRTSRCPPLHAPLVSQEADTMDAEQRQLTNTGVNGAPTQQQLRRPTISPTAPSQNTLSSSLTSARLPRPAPAAWAPAPRRPHPRRGCRAPREVRAERPPRRAGGLVDAPHAGVPEPHGDPRVGRHRDRAVRGRAGARAGGLLGGRVHPAHPAGDGRTPADDRACAACVVRPAFEEPPTQWCAVLLAFRC